MTPRIAAIFGAEPTTIVANPVVVPVEVKVANPVEVVVDAPIIKPVPIIPGTEHFSIWVSDEAGPWAEFEPGFHYDFRQPSRLHGLCAPPTPNAKGTI